MVTYKKYKNKLEKFLQTERGKRFLNFAYSWGAAVVIIGAMLKVLHVDYANVVFAAGMIVEACIFALSSFDTPIRDYKWEEVFPVLSTNNPDDRPEFSGGGSGGNGGANIQIGGSGGGTPSDGNAATTGVNMPPQSGNKQPIVVNISGGGTGGNYQGGGYAPASYRETPPSGMPQTTTQTTNNNGANIPQQTHAAPANIVTANNDVGQLASVADNVTRFADATETLTKISESLQESYRHIIDNSQNISQNSLGYVQQMEALNRNITGLNTIYEIQLKSISGQLDTIEQINNGLSRIKTMYNDAIPDGFVIKEETEKMADQLRELNQVYARMLDAMTNSHPATRNP